MPISFAQMTTVPQHPSATRSGHPVASLVIVLTLLSAAVADVRAATPQPAEELALAQSAISRAERADAAQYAGEGLLRARAALTQAQTAQASRRAADAVIQAQLAAAEADLAYARSIDATSEAEFNLRRNEIRELRARLGLEATP